MLERDDRESADVEVRPEERAGDKEGDREVRRIRFLPFLLVSQRRHRIDARGAPGW
jgi:hypothetical protein